jgi:hypothetical protein
MGISSPTIVERRKRKNRGEWIFEELGGLEVTLKKRD